MKRLFDIVFAFLGIIALLPLFAVIAILVKLNSKGPIIYKSQRVGRFQKEFTLLKFRTMVIDADKLGPEVTGANDLRVTRIGRLLRKTKLDELPQLINVLVGQMSFVGPRPEAPKYVALYTDTQRQVLSVRPGITSPASLQYRYEETLLVGDNWEQYYVEHVMPVKIAIDLVYVQKNSLLQDIFIILQTIRGLF